MKTILHRLIPLVMLHLLAMPLSVKAQTQAAVTTLHSFLGPAGGQGSNLTSQLVQGSNGVFFGTTVNGGTNNDGTVFSIAADGSFATLYSFQTISTDGETPGAPLFQGSDGFLYGTTQGTASNPGTIFKITTSGNLTTLYDFPSLVTSGNHPQAPLIEGGDGNFYGTTSGGGSSSNAGTFFKITPTGMLTILYTFVGNLDGAGPEGLIVLGSDGNFYGTTFSGGTNNSGTVYQLTPAGVLTTLHTFTGGTGGSAVRGGLVIGSDGALYGTTESGGANNGGTVFRITEAGEFTTLYTFSATDSSGGTNNDGAVPYGGLSVGSDGNLYGGTGGGGSHNAGTLFRITPTGVLTSLYSFTVPGSGFVNSDGATPYAPPVEGSDGNFYGTTYVGGSSGKGVVYQMKLAPVITSAAGAHISVGQTFSYQITAAFNPTSYAASGLPTGLTIDATTGVLSGTIGTEGDYVITLSATNAIGTGTQTLTVQVGTATPTVTLAATTPTVTTGSGQVGEFTLTLSAAQSSDVVVNYAVKGTAINGTDYVQLSGTKKIKAGKTGKLIKIEPLGGLGGTGKKTVVLELEPGTGYTVGTTGKVKVKIMAGQ